MSLYDNYSLENSTQTPAYVGSDVGTKISVLSQLNQQYNQNREADDILSRTAADNTNVAGPDYPEYNKMINQYRQNIAQRAQSGNYEDMQLGTTQDAYNFAKDAQPFAINKSLIMNRLAEIQKMADKGLESRSGGGISAATADALKAEIGQYSGLKKDPTTGEYSNYFSAHAIAPDVDVAKHVDQYMHDAAVHKWGSDVKQQEDENGVMHYITRAGTSETLSPDQVKEIINSASNVDTPFVQSLAQQKRLGTIGTENVTYDQVANQSPQAKAAADNIQAEAQRQGTTFGNIYKQMRQQAVQNDVASKMWEYGISKYAKNDQTTKFSDDGLTEAEKKKLDAKDDNNFAIPVTLGAYGSAFDTPEKLSNEQAASVQRQQATQAGMADWISKNGIKQVGTGANQKYIDQNGTDVTDQAMRQQLQVQQEQSHQATLLGIQSAAAKEANYDPKASNFKAAEQARHDAITQAIMNRSEDATSVGDQAYEQALHDSNPNYDKYEQIIKQKAQAQTITTSAMRFQNKADNEKLEELANNLSTPDFKNTLLGLKHIGTQPNNGQALTPDEYDQIKGKIHFAGQVVGADGAQHSIFKAIDKKGNETQFSMDGVASTQPMPKLLGVDANQLYTQQMIRAATNNPNKTMRTKLSNGQYLNLRVLGPDEAGQDGNGKYKMSLTDKDGKGGWEVNVDDESQALQRILAIQKLEAAGGK